MRSSVPVLVAATLLLASAAGQAQAPDQSPAPQAQPSVDPLDITGRTFSGLSLPVSPVDGRVELRARRAYVWTESERTSPRPVQRVLLEGDVELALGLYEFSAGKAAVWIEPIERDGQQLWQVFALLDRAGNSTEAAAITIAGDRLPVQGLIRAPEGVQLQADKLLQGRPRDRFLTGAEASLAQRLRRLVSPTAPTDNPEELLRRGEPVPPLAPIAESDEQALARERREIAALELRLPAAERDEPIFSRQGVISLAAGDIKIVPEGERKALTVSGGLTVTYIEREPGAGETAIQISAERGVVFLDPGADASTTSWSAADVSGIYLEGDVQALITTPEGKYTIRSPRVFYDVRTDRGLLVDALFSTQDARTGLPLHVRAKSIEQLSANTFRANTASVTNTPFLDPDLSIGASSVTITQRPTAASENRRLDVDARDITLRAGTVPFFWWPRLRGDPGLFPLRDIRLENSSGSGGALKTTWNAYTLFGIDPPEGTSLELLLDYYFDRGPGLGSTFSWRGADYTGNFFAYMVPNDTGQDLLVTGAERDVDGEFRGLFVGEHRARVGRDWTVFAEGMYVSDPTFIDGFFEPLARTRREFTNSIYGQRIRDNTLLFAEARGSAIDSIPNEYLLQSPGYSVTRLPDLGYVRIADDLLEEYPGLLSYNSQYRFTHMRLEFPDPEVRDLGFTTLGRSMALFGIAPDQSISDALRGRGLSEDWVSRFDTRHELTMPLAAGPVNITPFVVARFTGYDQDFDEYSPDADESSRIWGAAGVTLSTEIQRVDNSVESRLLDLHRTRHIISPNVTVWTAGTNIHHEDLPTYDPGVESIAEGTALRLGVNQVWQTQRGGPGRWRSVDVFTLNTELVFSSEDVEDEGPINRYFSYRPEYSVIGNTFANVEAAWQVTEVFALSAHEIYDFDSNQSDRTGVGALIQHAPEFSTFAELRYINPQDQTYALFGANYELTRKYAIMTSLNYDTDRGDVQSVNAQIRRRFPSIVLGVGVGYNNITSETSFGFVIQPFGLQTGGGFQGLGSQTGRFDAGG